MKATGTSTFVQAVDTLAETNISGFVSAFKGSSSKVKNVGSTLTSALASGVKSKSNTLSTTASNMAESMKNSIASKDKEFQKVGVALISALAIGIQAQVNQAVNAANYVGASAANGSGQAYTSFYMNGINLGRGLVLGMNAMQQSAYNSGYALGQAAVRGEKDGQKSHSPSKLTIQAGKWLGEGLIIGMNAMESKTYGAGKSMGETAFDSIRSALSGMNDIIDSDMDTTASNAASTANAAKNTADSAKSTADSANNKIDNLKVGGRNLIPVGMIKNFNGLSTFSYDKTSNTWTCVAPIGSNLWGRGIYFDTGVKKIYIPRGYTYIISLEVNPEVACIWNADINNGFDGMPSGTGNDNDNTSLRKSSDHSLVANKWQRVWFSYTPRTDVSYDIFDASSDWGIITTDAKSPIKFKIRNVKGEFGTVPTDWTPAPEDVDNKIDTAQKSADNANSSVNALNKIATKSYSFGGANGKAQWVRLGTLTSAGDASVVVIILQTGNGYNGMESQNSQAEIIIKDGWQDKASTTAAFGASVTRQNTKDLLVSVRATASNVCEVWAYLPWLYWNGNYTISGVYSEWNPNFTKQDTKPTNGVEQSLAYRTTAEDAYTLATGLKKDVDISSEFVKTYNDWAFKWKTATMVDGAEVGTYQKYITLESGNILLGHSNSKNKLKITNDSIQFKGTSDTAIKPDSDATAWITGKVFHINSGEIESSLKFGNILMKPTSEGNLALGNYAEFGKTVRIGTGAKYTGYADSNYPFLVSENADSALSADWPLFAIGNDGYAFTRNGVSCPGDLFLKFGTETLNGSGSYCPYFTSTDSVSGRVLTAGYVTNGSTYVDFVVPLSKPVVGANNVSVWSIGGLIVRQGNKYLFGSLANKYVQPSTYEATLVMGGMAVNIIAKMPNSTNVVSNNDACGIDAQISINFYA